MIQNYLLTEIKEFLEDNYENLFIHYVENQFIGCKYDEKDEDYIFYISDKTLLYKVNDKKYQKKQIANLSLEKLIKQIIKILNNLKIRVSKSNIQTLVDTYYHPEKMNLKLEITEDEYDDYINFGIEIGLITINFLKNILSDRELNIFKMRMNITDCDKNTLSKIGLYYNLSRERIRQILNNIMVKIKFFEYSLRQKYVSIFNNLEGKCILNYLLVGIENIYNNSFLEFVLSIIDSNVINLIDRINDLYVAAKKESNNQFVNYNIEEKLYKLINFPLNINEKGNEIFNKLHVERQTFEVNNNGVEQLTKFNTKVDYESILEKKIIRSYSKCNFVTNIKTQSLIINYTFNNQSYHYYPDIELLINGKIMAIIEVKSAYFMIDKHNLIKYKVLKEYGTKHGFGYAMIDEHFNNVEKILNMNISKEITQNFINFVKNKKSINYLQFRKFKQENNLRFIELEAIILNNQNIIEYQSKPTFKITYIGM